MAAIIAQMNIRNRARKKRRREQKCYGSSKSTSELQPFDQRFDPKQHNRYIRGREKMELEKVEVTLKYKESLVNNEDIILRSTYVSKRTFIEACIIGL